jgi:hypothetical protein
MSGSNRPNSNKSYKDALTKTVRADITVEPIILDEVEVTRPAVSTGASFIVPDRAPALTEDMVEEDEAHMRQEAKADALAKPFTVLSDDPELSRAYRETRLNAFNFSTDHLSTKESRAETLQKFGKSVPPVTEQKMHAGNENSLFNRASSLEHLRASAADIKKQVGTAPVYTAPGLTTPANVARSSVDQHQDVQQYSSIKMGKSS